MQGGMEVYFNWIATVHKTAQWLSNTLCLNKMQLRDGRISQP